MAKEMEIYFADLKPEAQRALLNRWETTVKDENWDVFPIALIVRDIDD